MISSEFPCCGAIPLCQIGYLEEDSLINPAVLDGNEAEKGENPAVIELNPAIIRSNPADLLFLPQGTHLIPRDIFVEIHINIQRSVPHHFF